MAFPSPDPKRWKYRYPLRQRLAASWHNHRPAGVDPLLAEKAAAQLLRRPEKAATVLATMPMDMRRSIALSWALTELEEEFSKADTDKDGKLDFKDFQNWAHNIIESGPQRDTTPDGPSSWQLTAICVTTMVPFIGFGLVDNGLMVIYGDVIDATLGMYLGFSMLASAALANAISNIFGMLLHGTITKWADKVGLPDARLTLAQRKMPMVHRFVVLGSCIGVFSGCLLGMSPLLFMDQNKKEAERSAEKVHH